MNIIETVAGSALKKVAGEESAALTKFLKTKIINIWQEHIGEQELKQYQSKILGYLYFFTINNPDQKSYIKDIYVPLNIKTGDNHKYDVKSLLNKGVGFSVVSGVAGHGKSTFLRHLMWLLIVNESLNEIPVFFELKYFQDDNLENQICEWFNQCGLNIEINFVKKLLQEGRFTIFLDAFDELPSDLMDICEQRIVEFRQKYSDINIIVTTRPNLQICQNSFGNHFKMVDLNRHQTTEILRKICNTKEDAQRAARAIYSSNFVSEAIKTPILVVLVSLTYKRWMSIPKTMSEFYNRVFNTLLSIHDNTKSGKRIRREINSKLEDTQILSVVNQLSYYLTIDEKYNFTHLDFELVCIKSLEKKSFETSEVKSVFKCLKSACNILVKDGFDEYKYIHRSFQEFYAAKYIESLHHSKKKIFYSQCLEKATFRKQMRKVLEFLFEIDEVYMYEYLVIPYLKQNKCIMPYKDYHLDTFRYIYFTHILELLIESKRFCKNGEIIETDLSNLFVYMLIFDDDFVDTISEQINIEICNCDFSQISEKQVSSYTLFGKYKMYLATDIIKLFNKDNSFIANVCGALEDEFYEAESILDEKLGKIFEKIEAREDYDISDL